MNLINKVDGVVDTTSVEPKILSGTGYATAPLGLRDVLSKDGTFLKAPRNVIFEIKNLNTDIRGIAI